MSVNNLLNDSGNKGWANLFINSMTVYNNLTVNQDLEILGDILNSAGSTAAFFSVTVDSLLEATTLDVTGNIINLNPGSVAEFNDATVNSTLDVIGNITNSNPGSTAGFNSVTVDSTLSVAGTDITPETTLIQYSLDDPTRFTGAYIGSNVRFTKMGDIVTMTLSFINSGNETTQNGPDRIIFNPDTPVPAQFLPAQPHAFSAQYRINNGAGSFFYFAPGSLAIDVSGNLTFKLTRDDAGTLKADQVPDGLVLATEYLPATYSTESVV